METFLPRQFFICSAIELLLTTIATDFAFVKDLLTVMGSEHIRSDCGSEFTAQEGCKLLDVLVVNTPLAELRGGLEKSYVESFSGTITQDELLNREPIDTLLEAKCYAGIVSGIIATRTGPTVPWDIGLPRRRHVLAHPQTCLPAGTSATLRRRNPIRYLYYVDRSASLDPHVFCRIFRVSGE